MSEAVKTFSDVEAEEGVFNCENKNGTGNFLLICEHASNFVPERYENLGLPQDTLNSHIAWDPGAIEVAKEMSRLLDAPLISQNISRLVYDCNRPTSAKSAIPEKSEIYEIPGNQDLTDIQIKERIETVYEPFRTGVHEHLNEKFRSDIRPVIATIHTFTPVYHGKFRDVEIGILHDNDKRIADLMMGHIPENSPLHFARNQPYGPENGVTHSLLEYGIKKQLANVMIEIRNDLVGDEKGQVSIAQTLVELLRSSVANLGDGESIARA